MAVNLSRKQLCDPELLSYIRRALDAHGVPPGLINLEITESMVMQHDDVVLQVIKDVRSMGLKVSMDDFGTGHSSLACLNEFPVDVLKIDRSFMTNLSGRRHT